ncbi:MAG TPA: TOBE domain-containing protein [Verrucomicrobiae bacterium]|nr:TOBE domain-containing protein [Verrucomicrobiae bacterium]
MPATTGSFNRNRKRNGHAMKYGARNKLTARVTSVKSDSIMSLVKFDLIAPAQMASVLTTESLQDLDLKPGDVIQLIVKAIHVLPVKE